MILFGFTLNVTKDATREKEIKTIQLQQILSKSKIELQRRRDHGMLFAANGMSSLSYRSIIKLLFHAPIQF